MRGKTYYKGSVVDHWAVFCYESPGRFNENACQKFISALRRFSGENGLQINGDPSVKGYIRDVQQVSQCSE